MLLHPQHPQYLIDAKGQRRSVMVCMEGFRELLENAQDVMDATLIDEVEGDGRVPWRSAKDKRGRCRRS